MIFNKNKIHHRKIYHYSLKSVDQNSFFINRKGYFLISLLILMILLAGTIFGLAKKNFIDKTKKTPETAVFKKSWLSDFEYQGEIPQVLTASLGRKNTGVAVSVKRHSAEINFQIPIESPQIESQKNNYLVYQSKDNIIKAKYQLTTKGLKEEIILNRIPQENKFSMKLNIKNLQIKTTPEGAYVFYDLNGNYQFHFERPYVKDGVGNISYAVSYQIMPLINQSPTPPPTPSPFLKKTGQKNQRTLLGESNFFSSSQDYLLTIEVDKKWLHDEKRVLPIIIDPTIIHDTSSAFASGTFNRVIDTGSSSSPSLESYYQHLPADINTAGLWHMNETSGSTVADSSSNGNNGVAIGTSIVSSFSSFGNARSFNGTSDYISVPDNDTLDPQIITIEVWVRPSSSGTNNGNILNKGDNSGYRLRTVGETSTYGYFVFHDRGATNMVTSNQYKYFINQWYYVVVTADSTGLRMYVNGVLAGTSNTAYGANNTSNPLQIGACTTFNEYFHGVIDEVRISNRVLTPEEIQANAQRRSYGIYTSPVIDLTSGIGTVSAWNNLTWTGRGIKTTDGETPISTNGLLAQWNFNETSGTTAASGGSCGSSCNGTLTNFANTSGQDVVPGSGWTAQNRRWGNGALMFDGSDDYVNTSLQLNYNQDFTIESWVKPMTKDSTQWQKVIASTRTGALPSMDLYLHTYSSTQTGFGISVWNNAEQAYSAISLYSDIVEIGNWYHIVGVYRSNNNLQIFVNGILRSETTVAGFSGTGGGGLRFGIHDPNWAGRHWNGIIDISRVYSRALTAAEVLANYQAGQIELQTRTSADNSTWEEWRPVSSESQILSLDSDQSNWSISPSTAYTIAKSDDSNIKIEGSSSMMIALGMPKVDANTVGLWRLEETSGTGAYLKDSTANANHGTPTGTTAADGFYGKTRRFNGTSDFVTIPNSASLNINGAGSAATIELWFKPTTLTPTWQNLIYKNNGGADCNQTNCSDRQYALWLNNTGYIHFVSTSVNNIGVGHTVVNSPTGVISANNWYHVVGVIDSPNSIMRLFINGQSVGQTSYSNTGIRSANGNLFIGATHGSSSFFNGLIDEVRISNVARSVEEIAEAYRAGRDHRLSRTISSVDLSNRAKLPFYIAADRPGTYLEAVIGESAYVNYEPDANTAGLWRLEEASGTGAYLKDSTANANHGTPTGTTFTQGKIGKARRFNGTSDFIDVPDSNSLDLTDNFTIEAWVNLSSNNTTINKGIIDKGINAYALLLTATNASPVPQNSISLARSGVGIDAYSSSAIPLNQWTHIAATKNGSIRKIYINGVDVTTLSTQQTFSVTTDPLRIGSRNPVNTDGYINGQIDEIRISNTTRSAEEIRQAYEIGRRTYPITIDFVTSPYAVYSSGTTVMLNNPWGTTALTDTLKVGDTVIFQENVNGNLTIGQATVAAIHNTSATYGTITLVSAPPFPSGGYSTNARVFKWQREYFDITGSLPNHRDATTRITLRVIDGSQGANIWLDDFKTVTSYIADNIADSFNILTGIGTYSNISIASTPQRYFQYRVIFSSWDNYNSASLNSLTLDYQTLFPPQNCLLEEHPQNSQIIIKWIDSNTSEDGYHLEKSTNSGAFSNLHTTGANATSYIDSSVSGNNTYQYRIRAKYGNSYSDWCLTPTLNLGVGNFRFEGIRMEGIKID